MIEGLKLDFSGKELQEHLKKKSNHHLERTAFYSKQADALAAGNVGPTQYTGGDPVKVLRDKAAEHRRRSELLTLISTHVAENETYRLQDTDLTRLELISAPRLHFI